MSVDATALERSALESKDRDELITIAKALGGKPPARAKKAAIVDLVLELTGVGAAPVEADTPAVSNDGTAPSADDAASPSGDDSPPAEKKPRSRRGGTSRSTTRSR